MNLYKFKFYFNSKTKKTYYKLKRIKIKDGEIFHINPNGSVNFSKFIHNTPACFIRQLME